MESKLKTSELTKNDIAEIFIDLLKICKPEHPYESDSEIYENITIDDIEISYCRSDSKYYARCGASDRKFEGVIAKYSFDLEYYQNSSIEKILAITTHELTHITVGSVRGWYTSGHPPEFWDEMAFNAQLVLDYFQQIQDKWGNIDEEKYKRNVIQEANRFNIDKRTNSVEQLQNRLESFLLDYPINKCI